MKYLKTMIILVAIIILGIIIYLFNYVSNDKTSIINNNTTNITQSVNKNNITNNMSGNTSVNSNNSNDNNITSEITYEEEKNLGDKMVITGQVKEVTSGNMFFIMEKCIQNYINSIVNKDVESIYNQLSIKYILSKNINTSNVLQYVENISEYQEFRALKMDYVQGKVYDQYRVYGKLLSTNGSISNIYFVININTSNLAYAVVPQLNNNYKNLSQVKIDITEEEIVKNNNNSAKYLKISDEPIIDGIMNDYQKNVLYDTKSAYDSLNEEYRKKRFKDYEEYFKYAQNKVYQIQNMKIQRHKKTEYTGYTEYECEDAFGNVYIIKAIGIREYTIILDDYTIENDSYKTEYASLDNTEKSKENVNRFIKMINNCDYRNCHKYLYSGFKNNYLKTQEDFEIYVKANFFEYNVVNSIDITEREDGICICNVTIKNGNNEETLTKNIIVQLGTGTDFEMSFDI